MNTLPPKQVSEMMKLFDSNKIVAYGDPLKTRKFNEDALLHYCKIINIVYKCLSTFKAALVAKDFKYSLWLVFNKVFGKHFDIPCKCQNDFINYNDKKIYTNI